MAVRKSNGGGADPVHIVIEPRGALCPMSFPDLGETPFISWRSAPTGALSYLTTQLPSQLGLWARFFLAIDPSAVTLFATSTTFVEWQRRSGECRAQLDALCNLLTAYVSERIGHRPDWRLCLRHLRLLSILFSPAPALGRYGCPIQPGLKRTLTPELHHRNNGDGLVRYHRSDGNTRYIADLDESRHLTVPVATQFPGGVESP